MSAQQIIQRAKREVLMEHPWFSTLVYKLRDVEVPGLGTTAIRPALMELRYDPDCVVEWYTRKGIEAIKVMVLHEIGHVLFEHEDRYKEFCRNNHLNPDEQATQLCFNVSGDCEIHQGGLIPNPEDFPLPLATNERMLEALKKDYKKPLDPSTKYFLEASLRDNTAECKYGVLEPLFETKEQPPAGCGRGTLDWGDEEEDKEAAQDLKDGLEDAAERLSKKKAGSKTLKRWAREYKLKEDFKSWRKLRLDNVVRRAFTTRAHGHDERSYSRLSRRPLPGLLTPGGVKVSPRTTVIIDVSGSMSGTAIDTAFSQLRGVLEAVGEDKLHVLGVDTTVQKDVVINPKNFGAAEVYKTFQVGGGTNLCSGFRHIANAQKPPDLVVVLSDCETPWPSERPSYPVIIGKIMPEEATDSSWGGATPDWATVVPVFYKK